MTIAYSLQTVDVNEILSEKKFSYSREKPSYLHLQIASLQKKARHFSYKNSLSLKTHVKESVCKNPKKSCVPNSLNFEYIVVQK